MVFPLTPFLPQFFFPLPGGPFAPGAAAVFLSTNPSFVRRTHRPLVVLPPHSLPLPVSEFFLPAREPRGFRRRFSLNPFFFLVPGTFSRTYEARFLPVPICFFSFHDSLLDYSLPQPEVFFLPDNFASSILPGCPLFPWPRVAARSLRLASTSPFLKTCILALFYQLFLSPIRLGGLCEPSLRKSGGLQAAIYGLSFFLTPLP